MCNYEIINTPIFKPGENSTVKLNITNSANESKTVIVVVVLIPYLGPYRTPSLAYAESDKEITVAANSTVTEDFNLEVVGFTSPGDYNLTVYEVINNNATLALTTATEVLAKYTITTEMPDDITYKQPFTFNVTLRNTATAPIHNISVELDTHYYFNTTEPLEKEILALDAGENYTFTWSLTPIDYGDLRVDVIVYTSDAGSETKIAYISVLSTPKLWITAQVPEKVNKSDDFILNATVFNSGDIPSDNVTLNLTTPENVTANRTSTELGIIEAHENKTCSVRISQNESRDFMIILNATSLNVTATGYAFITISQLPIAYFTYEPQNPVVNQTITFNASSSYDLDGGNITNYEWDFGDGNITNTTEEMITHSYALAGNYNVSLTVTDDDGATNTSVARITVSSMPDLVITGKWVCWPDNCTICYNVTNIGDGGTAPAGYYTTLFVDSVEEVCDYVPVPLMPNESYIGCFDDYNWTYTTPKINITVCADNNETIEESNETNNCLENIWMCGDVNEDGTANVVDVLHVYRRALDPDYPLELPWAADVYCDGTINVLDVLGVYRHALDPGYDLDCCCE